MTSSQPQYPVGSSNIRDQFLDVTAPVDANNKTEFTLQDFGLDEPITMEVGGPEPSSAPFHLQKDEEKVDDKGIGDGKIAAPDMQEKEVVELSLFSDGETKQLLSSAGSVMIGINNQSANPDDVGNTEVIDQMHRDEVNHETGARQEKFQLDKNETQINNERRSDDRMAFDGKTKQLMGSAGSFMMGESNQSAKPDDMALADTGGELHRDEVNHETGARQALFQFGGPLMSPEILNSDHFQNALVPDSSVNTAKSDKEKAINDDPSDVPILLAGGIDTDKLFSTVEETNHGLVSAPNVATESHEGETSTGRAKQMDTKSAQDEFASIMDVEADEAPDIVPGENMVDISGKMEVGDLMLSDNAKNDPLAEAKEICQAKTTTKSDDVFTDAGAKTGAHENNIGVDTESEEATDIGGIALLLGKSCIEPSDVSLMLGVTPEVGTASHSSDASKTKGVETDSKEVAAIRGIGLPPVTRSIEPSDVLPELSVGSEVEIVSRSSVASKKVETGLREPKNGYTLNEGLRSVAVNGEVDVTKDTFRVEEGGVLPAPGMGLDHPADALTDDTVPLVVPPKRSPPDQAPDQPLAKKAKRDAMMPNLDVSEVTLRLVAPESHVGPQSTPDAPKKTDEAALKVDEVKSEQTLSENAPSGADDGKTDCQSLPACDPVFASLVDLSPIPDVAPLPLLSPRDFAELESALQVGDKYSHSDDNCWRDDWSGNLQLIDKELLMNRGQIAKDPQTKPLNLPFVEWVANTAKDPDGFRGVQLLFSYVYHMKGTPPMAQKIMAYSLQRPAKTIDERSKYITDGIRRITYDPTVLNQDGWTTVKAESPDGVSGGAFLIGRRVIWHRYEAIVIAFVRDEELGDLWKAIWLEDHDTFDLEADELQEALKKWERRENLKRKKSSNRHTLLGGTVKPQGHPGREKAQSASMRFAASSSFTIDGIEHGIVLATSFNHQARHGIPWPARVMHVSEIKALGAQPSSRRSSSKNNINVVFLAPYWNGQYAFSSKKPTSSDSKAASAKDPFSTGPLFEMDVVEVSEGTIKKYPFDVGSNVLSIDKLKTSFRFLGLPKAAFPRYLTAHRLAMALKSYAKNEVYESSTSNGRGQPDSFAAMTETHALSVLTHIFPQASLDLPFDFILSKLPCPVQQAKQVADDMEEVTEPVINLHAILMAMSPPRCYGEVTGASMEAGHTRDTPQSNRGLTPVKSPDPTFNFSAPSGGEGKDVGDDSSWSVQSFASDYLLKVIESGPKSELSSPKLPFIGRLFSELVETIRKESNAIERLSLEIRRERLGAFLKQCIMIKGHGEDIISSNKVDGLNSRNVLIEWRKACERVYRRASVSYSLPKFGDGVTTVITDSRCNQHITASGSFERAVRLPAAIKGAKKAGAGAKDSIALICTVENSYMELAEEKVLLKAHKAAYLKRLKTKIDSIAPDAKGMPLTDDSDGEGGEDTMGSRGSYTAAVIGVAAALQGVDMIVGGQCVNVFCAVRPPGHHAGRELRPMNAISNGFCLLNAAACAALYATAPISEGGLGLKRVCVIDFDVHHGNGTQDILCSTRDSRFLYVSLHAGGAHINGYDAEGDAQDGHNSLGGGKHEGIFPGRCGDTSPHEGVLNIPLGRKVTAAAVGSALVTKVSPAVEDFCPELIVLSAGFDAHKNDPLGMGGLSAEDFGSVTEVACQMAFKTCSGRVLSVLEGGYGVPCCRPQSDTFLPENLKNPGGMPKEMSPVKLIDLGDDLPDSMDDPVTLHLQQKLERCHQEGFVDCVRSHVGSLAQCNKRGK